MPSHQSLSQQISRDNVDVVVQCFYRHVLNEPRLAGYFAHIENWHEHEAHIADFWWGIMGGEVAHPHPQAMDRGHRNLDFSEQDLELWLNLFAQTLHESLPGDIAERWDALARQLGRKMRERGLGQAPSHE